MEKLRKLNKKNFENGCWGRGGGMHTPHYLTLLDPPLVKATQTIKRL